MYARIRSLSSNSLLQHVWQQHTYQQCGNLKTTAIRRCTAAVRYPAFVPHTDHLIARCNFAARPVRYPSAVPVTPQLTFNMSAPAVAAVPLSPKDVDDNPLCAHAEHAVAQQQQQQQLQSQQASTAPAQSAAQTQFISQQQAPDGKPTLQRLPTLIEKTITQHDTEHTQRLASLLTTLTPHYHCDAKTATSIFFPHQLNGCIFLGHLSPDVDSIASAIAASYLFSGIPSRSEDLNAEAQFVLQYWQATTPLHITEAIEHQQKNWPGDQKDLPAVVMVDHNQRTQLHPAVQNSAIRGIIDHHGLAGTVETESPIFTLIEPWGSTCTLIASLFVRFERPITQQIAGLLLSGILSDTLNLTSPTTTNTDRFLLTLLCRIAAVENITALAKKQFAAKSKNLPLMTAAEIVKGDMKQFSFTAGMDAALQPVQYKIGVGTVETVEEYVNLVTHRKQELLQELELLRVKMGVQLIFLSVVDITNLYSVLLVRVQHHVYCHVWCLTALISTLLLTSVSFLVYLPNLPFCIFWVHVLCCSCRVKQSMSWPCKRTTAC